MGFPRYVGKAGCDWCAHAPFTWMHLAGYEAGSILHRKLCDQCIAMGRKEGKGNIFEPLGVPCDCVVMESH
jgi:hypothetical protein